MSDIRITKKHVLFWWGIFCNWTEVENGIPFEYQGESHIFPTSEHIYMWLKAKYFNDEESANEILETESPKWAKEIGKKVKGFSEEKWSEEREHAMWLALNAKYDCDEKFRKELRSSKYWDKTFVEASPYDRIWGIGIEKSEPGADDESKWKGLNTLGKLLTKLRDEKIKGVPHAIQQTIEW